LQWASVAALVGVGVGWVDVRLVAALVGAVRAILQSLGDVVNVKVFTYKSIQEDIKSSDGINIDRVAALVQAGLLGPDDRVRGLEVQRALNYLGSKSDRQVGRLPTIDRNEFRYHIGRNLGRRKVLEKRLQVGKIEVIGPFGYTQQVAGMIVLANRDVVDGAQAINCDQCRTTSQTREAGDVHGGLDCGSRLSDWSKAIELDCGHDEIDVFADMLRNSVFIACNAVATSLFVLIVVIFCLEEAFKLGDCG
jgi:hypothetical protein